jgi:hypothetical protein
MAGALESMQRAGQGAGEALRRSAVGRFPWQKSA